MSCRLENVAEAEEFAEPVPSPRSVSVSDVEMENHYLTIIDDVHEPEPVAQPPQTMFNLNIPTANSPVPRDEARRNTAIMKFLVLVLLGLITIKYQVSPQLLFVDNGVQVGCFIVSYCMYWITIQMLETWNRLNRILIYTLNCILDVCEVVSVVSFLSLLLPQHVPILVFIAFLLAMIVLRIFFRTHILERFSRATPE